MNVIHIKHNHTLTKTREAYQNIVKCELMCTRVPSSIPTYVLYMVVRQGWDTDCVVGSIRISALSLSDATHFLQPRMSFVFS